ncbi:hypothetical protein [Hymenobacter sp. B81]|uniref:hypothetical protein n=1 Tax=Hymenobacter sp. B81 TaxID=3344878 RepID=UPI0037DC8411
MNALSTTAFVRRRALLPLLTVLLLASGCEKVSLKPKLPDATQEGKNTYGCLLNDKVWLPHSDHTLLPPLDADLTTSGFTLKASDDHDDAPGWEEFNLALNTSTLAPGTYTLADGFTARYWSRDNDLNNIQEYTAGVNTGNYATLTITKVEPRTTTTTVLGNTVTSRFTIISGTFAFSATSADGKTLTVKDGRFDVQAF